MWLARLYAANWETECNKYKDKLQPNNLSKTFVKAHGAWRSDDCTKLQALLEQIMNKYWVQPNAEESPHAEKILIRLGGFLTKMSNVVLAATTYTEVTKDAAKCEHSFRKKFNQVPIEMGPLVLKEPVKTAKELVVCDKQRLIQLAP